jgi:hypothetical protein
VDHDVEAVKFDVYMWTESAVTTKLQTAAPSSEMHSSAASVSDTSNSKSLIICHSWDISQ